MEYDVNDIIKWFENNVFLFDNLNHNTLKKSDFTYVEGKINFTYPFLETFEAWSKINPENLYNKKEFLKWGINQWIARIKNQDYYATATLASFCQALVCYKQSKNLKN